MEDALKLEYKIMILRALEYHFPQAKIYLFGSRARGDNKPGSDIDIAVDNNVEIVPRELWRAKNTLENLFIPFRIDLVDMQAISEELKKTILDEGILWKK